MREIILAMRFDNRWYRLAMWSSNSSDTIGESLVRQCGSFRVLQMADMITDLKTGKTIKSRHPDGLTTLPLLLLNTIMFKRGDTITFDQLYKLEPRLNWEKCSG